MTKYPKPHVRPKRNHRSREPSQPNRQKSSLDPEMWFRLMKMIVLIMASVLGVLAVAGDLLEGFDGGSLITPMIVVACVVIGLLGVVLAIHLFLTKQL